MAAIVGIEYAGQKYPAQKCENCLSWNSIDGDEPVGWCSVKKQKMLGTEPHVCTYFEQADRDANGTPMAVFSVTLIGTCSCNIDVRLPEDADKWDIEDAAKDAADSLKDVDITWDLFDYDKIGRRQY